MRNLNKLIFNESIGSSITNVKMYNQYLYLNTYENGILLYEAKTFEKVLEKPKSFFGHKNKNFPIKSTMINKDDKYYIASGSTDSNIYLYDISNEKDDSIKIEGFIFFFLISGNKDIVYDIQYDKIKNNLITCSSDKTIKFFKFL
jgi:WD40 repeat protein